METRDWWLYSIGLALVVAVVALAGCGGSRLHGDPGDGALHGTVRSVLAAQEPEEPWEDTHLSYEDPADGEPREEVRVRLDDGREVVILYVGPRHLAPGQRVRVYFGDRSAVLL